MKRKITLIVISVLILICMILSVTYAYYTLSFKSDINIATSVNIPSCAYLELETESELRLTGDLALPVSDDKVLSSDQYRFEFTAINECDTASNLNIALAPTNDSTMPLKAIKYALIEKDSADQAVAKFLTEDATRRLLSEQVVQEIYAQTSDNIEIGYEVARTSLNPNEEKSYYLYVWIDYYEGEDPESGNNGITMNKTVKAHLVISDYASGGGIEYAVMVYDNNQETYVEKEVVPAGAYELNGELSYCESGRDIESYDNENGIIYYDSTSYEDYQNDKCYFYFTHSYNTIYTFDENHPLDYITLYYNGTNTNPISGSLTKDYDCDGWPIVVDMIQPLTDQNFAVNYGLNAAIRVDSGNMKGFSISNCYTELTSTSDGTVEDETFSNVGYYLNKVYNLYIKNSGVALNNSGVSLKLKNSNNINFDNFFISNDGGNSFVYQIESSKNIYFSFSRFANSVSSKAELISSDSVFFDNANFDISSSMHFLIKESSDIYFNDMGFTFYGGSVETIEIDSSNVYFSDTGFIFYGGIVNAIEIDSSDVYFDSANFIASGGEYPIEITIKNGSTTQWVDSSIAKNPYGVGININIEPGSTSTFSNNNFYYEVYSGDEYPGLETPLFNFTGEQGSSCGKLNLANNIFDFWFENDQSISTTIGGNSVTLLPVPLISVDGCNLDASDFADLPENSWIELKNGATISGNSGIIVKDNGTYRYAN